MCRGDTSCVKCGILFNEPIRTIKQNPKTRLGKINGTFIKPAHKSIPLINNKIMKHPMAKPKFEKKPIHYLISKSV